MAEGWRMWAISLLTIMQLTLISAAPIDVTDDIKKEDVKADNDAMHSHDENVIREGKFFGHNQFDIGNINVSGSVAGDDVSIGHEVNIDVQGHNHDHHLHEDDTVIECKEGLREMFKSIDSNKDGLIDVMELLRVCHLNNIQITKPLAVRILTLPEKTVGFNIAKFCELLKDCPSSNSADSIYCLLQLFDKGKPWCKGRNYPGGKECCESEDPHGSKCTEGQGDCDSDDGCAGDLVCGKDNCRQYHSGASLEDDCCTKPDTPCTEPFAVPGPCKAGLPRWSYNQETGICHLFLYGGCQGNNNNFDSKEECAATCQKSGNEVVKFPILGKEVVKFPCEFDDDLLTPKLSGDGLLSPHDTSQYFKWKNNIIPYYYTNEKTKDEDKKLVRSVMDRFEEETCFKFLEKNKAEYEKKKEHSLEIFIEDNSCRGGFSGYVEKVPYKNKLQLKLTSHVTDQNGEDCGTKGLIIHELMHVLGVGHTQRRSDRDNFITVKDENLDLAGASETIEEQYRKCEDCKLYSRIPYDCGSIMHYGTHYMDKEVIIPKDVKTCKLERGHLVNQVWDAPSKDWELLNIIGNCPEPTSVQASPPNIYYAVEMHNIGKLLSGYDIMKGNPLPVDLPFPVDPGFRQPIFEASYQSGSMTADRRYLQPDGTTISSCIGACSLKFESTEISGSKSYQESLARKVGLSVGGSFGAWGGKFSASVGYKEVAEKTSSDSNLFTLSSASCCAYSAEILFFKHPSLSQNFRDGVETLTEKYDEKIYLNFIEAFGTHFIRKALMGALYGEQTEISKEAWITLQENGIDISTAAELSAYGVTGSASFDSSEDKKKAADFSKKAEDQKTFTIGVKPPADGKKGTWLQKTISDPAPIELTLGGSILDLLEHDDIKNKVSTAMKANMKRALDDYCNLLLKSGEAKTCSSPGPDPAFPSPASDTLYKGQSLKGGEFLRSDKGTYVFVVEKDGNMVIYENLNSGRRDKWESDTKQSGSGSVFFEFREDGNLVLSNNGKAVWDSGTSFEQLLTEKTTADALVLTKDGNLELQTRTKDVLWASNRGYIETPGLNLDAVNEWVNGKWGKKEKCSYPHFVKGMGIKFESRGIKDDSSLNAIRLTCTDDRTISSTEGIWGSYGDMFTCPEGEFINQAMIRNEKWDDDHDNTAANGIRFRCTDGSEYKPQEGNWGEWIAWKSCQKGSAVYGIQTLVQPKDSHSDETALNNVKFFCAKLP